jgi:hypothetical protein
MSNYGPPDGPWSDRSRDPHPGRPQDPWSGRAADEPYGQPADPWGGQQQSPWGTGPAGTPLSVPVWGGGPDGQPVSGQPAAGYPGQQPYQGYDPQPGWSGVPTAVGGPTAAPVRRRRGPVIALFSALVVLVLVGTVTVFYLMGRQAATDSAGGPVTATSGAATQPASTGPTPVASTPAPRSTSDAQFVKAGQCVRNESPAGERPRLTITTCGPQTYEVLQRFDGVTNGKEDALAKCAKVEGYTDWFFWNSELDSLDFVLCLKKR